MSAPSMVSPFFKAMGLLTVSLLLCAAPAIAKNGVPGGGGGGGGGTAKPPKPGTVVPTPPATLNIPVHAPPAVQSPPNLSAPVGTIFGFDATGFVQNATINAVTASCSVGHQGGTVTLNSRKIIVPCNTVVQFPANTLAWSDLFSISTVASLALDGTAPSASTATFTYPSIEISVAGNIVNGTSIAGLITFSQQSLNSGSGFITNINYADGSITVGDSPTAPGTARLVINDPHGQFGRPQSPDERFSVDDENPTIIAASGFPMCVPRTDPAGGQPDADCPQKNRPLVAAGCRNFAQAGVVSPAGWELAAPAGQTFCPAFVMENPALTTAKQDARKKAPLEVGDYIEYSGTLLRSKTGTVAQDTISVHTLHANVGIFTEPGTLPVYLSIEEAIIGTDAVPVAGEAPALPALEGQDRFVIVGVTTDVKTPVDVYLVDVDPASGQETQRWITTEGMTGGLAAGTPPFLGGIMTQFTGPQPGRFRLRANKPPAGILTSPTRNVRVVARTLCAPATTTGFFDINGGITPLAEGTGTATSCLERDPVANGLFAGQYLAPVSEYIFPENVVAGDKLVPYNFWALGFLVNGEGADRGPLSPTPW